MIFAIFLFTLVSAIYEDDTPVELLTKQNFDTEVIRSATPWIVEFYAPWCGHCKALKDDWETLARGMGNVVRVGAVDATVQTEIAGSYGIHGYPTILFFGQDKSAPKRYENARQADELAKFAIDEVEEMINRRLQVKGGRKKKRATEKKSTDQDQDQCGAPDRKNVSKDYLEGVDEEFVVELTEANFDELVMQSKDMWMVEFFAHWCGHCQQLAPQWGMAARHLAGDVKLGKVDSELNRKLQNKYGVTGFPSIKVFAPDDKENFEDYNGGRSAREIIDFALEKKKDYGKDYSAPKLDSHSTFLETCDKKKTMCVLFMVENEEQLDVLKPLVKKFQAKRVKFLWFNAGEQPTLESQFRAKGPNAIAVNYEKKKYYVMNDQFNAKTLTDFTNGIQKNKFFFLPFEEFPEISSS